MSDNRELQSPPQLSVPSPLDDKFAFLTAKTGWVELITLSLKCFILFYFEAALAKERERKAMIEKQQKNIEAENKIEHDVNKPPITSGDSVTL